MAIGRPAGGRLAPKRFRPKAHDCAARATMRQRPQHFQEQRGCFPVRAEANRKIVGDNLLWESCRDSMTMSPIRTTGAVPLNLSQLRCDHFDRSGKLLVKLQLDRPVPDFCARRIGGQIVTAFPVGFWTDGAGTKSAAAIRADIFQNDFHTVTAKSAFKRANHRGRGIRRQRDVAMFTGWP